MTTVYNITVADYHTYAIGKDEVLVHNKAMRTIPPQPGKGEIELVKGSYLKQLGIDEHELKSTCPGKPSEFDIYKDKKGNLWGFRKRGIGEGEYLGNINDFLE
jgi:hypothetical protein